MGKHGQKQDCKRCAGTGTVDVGGDGEQGNKPKTRSCPLCGGSGKV